MTSALNNKPDPDAAAKIRLLNDTLRTTGVGGRTMMTPGIAALSDAERDTILSAVAGFTAFDARNDPYGEHDCAIVAVGDLQVLWKIDYYDLDMDGHSLDSTDPHATCRVMTIMLAGDY